MEICPKYEIALYLPSSSGRRWMSVLGEATGVSNQGVRRCSDFKALGLVVRGSKGELIMARTVRIDEVLDPERAEVMAIKEALSWTKNTTWQNITVESDCLIAVQSIRSNVPMLSLFGFIIEECRRLLQNQNTVSLSFIRRSANRVAHELARASYSFPDRYFDRSSVPIEVDVALKADLS